MEAECELEIGRKKQERELLHLQKQQEPGRLQAQYEWEECLMEEGLDGAAAPAATRQPVSPASSASHPRYQSAGRG